MIKGEIRTDTMTYDISLNGFDDVEKAYDHIKATLEGDRTFRAEGGILEIGEAAQIKHIRVYVAQLYAGPIIEDPVEIDDVEEGNKGLFEFDAGRCTYLGHKLHLRGQAYEKNGHTWYLPMEINGQPALDVLGRDKLEELTYYWICSQGLQQGSYTILLPIQPLPDYEEARDYILDYVREEEADQEPTPTGKPNAKAWQGWKGEGTE